MRSTNTLTVIECINNYGPITKKEIQKLTNLSWGSISSKISELLRKKVITEFKSTSNHVGRIPLAYKINNIENMIIGIDFDKEGLRAVLTDLKSEVIKKVESKIDFDDTDKTLAHIKQLINTLIQASGVKKSNILGIGIAIQGTVDVEKGMSVYSPYIKDWKNIPVKNILETEFSIPVCIEHDPNCMALAEKWFGNAGSYSNFLFLRLTMGIGLSIFINNEIYRGADGSAGEFGHMIMNPAGPKCSCGNYGCLETYVSKKSIILRATEGVKQGMCSLLKKNGNPDHQFGIKEVAAAARMGDQYLIGLFNDYGTYLGIGISNLINIFNPEAIIIGGELSTYSDLYIDRIMEKAEQNVWKGSRINVITSKFGDDSAALGASAIILNKFFNGGLNFNMNFNMNFNA